jgi:hypothetical protein
MTCRGDIGLVTHNQPAGHSVAVFSAFCPQRAPSGPFLPVMQVRKHCSVYALRFELFHGIEEVIGSTPLGFTNCSL